MSRELLTVIIVGTAIAVIIGLTWVMWRARPSSRVSRVAIVAGAGLTVWALTVSVLAAQGVFLQRDQVVPPIGIALVSALAGVALALVSSRTLRSLLTNQKHLIWLNIWRLVGAVFLILMASRQMPALWALPAGIGDLIVGVAAPWVAYQVNRPGGRGIAVAFNVFGLLDLIVAVALGIMTGPRPLGVFETTPTSEFVTHFPLALVPTFLVPLASMLHIVSLTRLLGKPWSAGLSSTA